MFIFIQKKIDGITLTCIQQYLMEFNRSPGDLTALSPLFTDDNRVAEAASIAQKLSNIITLLWIFSKL